MEPTTAPGTLTLLTRLSKVVHRKTPEELLGMRWRQFLVLSYLAERDGVAQQDLGEVMGIDPNNLVLLLNELEAADYARRRRDPEDRRRHIVELTDNGGEALRRAERARETIEDEVLGALDTDEREQLRRLLIKALEG
ncbi:MAG TPA: MarR family winged helix-turn-helix transcriptional regulator [Solirubrobacteraceae bacterium]|nr:MarR family winged helix-turn-helix transcriptional regulator [Solirubrobacteraceae bacterium]